MASQFDNINTIEKPRKYCLLKVLNSTNCCFIKCPAVSSIPFVLLHF